jgi:predicted nuclease of restriction endonuclease-like (RecB) superfamily
MNGGGQMKDKTMKLRKVQQPAAQLSGVIENFDKAHEVKDISTSEYSTLLRSVKDRVRKAQLRAITGVNKELVLLYWDIGIQILRKQHEKGWGSKVIDQLSHDLSIEFPQMKGFSPRNLKYMRALAGAYPDHLFVQQVVAQLPWGHNVRILDHVDDPLARAWYIQRSLAHNWSRNVLVHQIEQDLYGRQGKALTNFERTLPDPASDLARETLKDPYLFDFLSLGAQSQERDLERALLDHIRDFLLELGLGFSFVGNQYPIEVGGEDFYIDLLFYHLNLRCFVVVDLKMGEFIPEYAGKMNFYLSAVDAALKHPEDGPSIGLILCKTRNKLVAEYTMRDINKPVGIATYQLPKPLKDNLPSQEMFEQILKEETKSKGRSKGKK